MIWITVLRSSMMILKTTLAWMIVLSSTPMITRIVTRYETLVLTIGQALGILDMR
jgi:hypothetical protein